jgi:serine/threonine protein kinase
MNVPQPAQHVSSSRSDGSGAGHNAAGAQPPLVPDYELIRRIGGGSYGEVWLARSTTGVLRAVKIVWRNTFADERPFQREFDGIQRFERLSRGHPSQLALFHVGRGEGYFFYIMELADDAGREWNDGVVESWSNGKTSPRQHSSAPALQDPSSYAPKTLRSLLRPNPQPSTLNPQPTNARLPAARVLEIGLALTEALAHLHSHGLVHRDVKPSNIIFVGGKPKLADIGLVTDASDTCSIVGTEGYLPPEGPGTPQADIFALGKVLYEAATGLDRREFPKLPEDLRSWPDAAQVFELNEIILKACDSDARNRYQSCAEMQRDLELLRQGRSVRRDRASGHRWAVVRKALGLAALFGVVAMAGVFLARQAHPIRPPSAKELYQQAVDQMKISTFDRRLQAYVNLAEAIKLDPGFVNAYYALFELYFIDGFGNNLPPHYNQIANLRATAEKLRELSPDSAQYHTANSLVKCNDWKLEEAIQEAALAIKLNPKFLRAHGLYGYYLLVAHGDTETALREYRIAEQIDPNDVTIQRVMGSPFYAERKFDLAIKQFNKAWQLDPLATFFLHRDLARAYEGARQYDKAINELEELDRLRGMDPEQWKAWYKKSREVLHDQEKGPRGWWQYQLDGARKFQHPDQYRMAELCARLGYTNEVFPFLEQAFQDRNYSLFDLLQNDCWDPLRQDPRFQKFLDKIGFHPKSVL